MNYTYILHCADGTLYCGWTNDLKTAPCPQQRHRSQIHKIQKVTLAYYEAFETKQEAMKREYAIKQLPEKERGADQSWLQYGSVHGCRGPGLCHKLIHHHIVTQTAAHDKQVKDLMGTEIAVSGIKDRQFQGVDDASNCVNDTACK